jgi:hypothetical protein
MKTSDWDDPQIRAIGAKWARDAYDIASEMSDFGADASELLLSYKDQDMTRPRTVTIPTKMADVLQAILLHLQRPPEPPLAEDVRALMKRIGAG